MVEEGKGVIVLEKIFKWIKFVKFLVNAWKGM